MKYLFLLIVTMFFCKIFSQPCHELIILGSEVTEEKLIGKPQHLVNFADDRFVNGWARGKVILVHGGSVNNVLLRYDRIIDDVFWLREKDYKKVILDKTLIKSFLIHLDTDKVLEFEKKRLPNNRTVFLQVLCKGDISLYKEYQGKIIKTTDEIHNNLKYLLHAQGEFHVFQPNNWSLKRVLKEDKSVVKSILRKNHLNMKRERDIIEFVRLYNLNKEISLSDGNLHYN